MPKNALPKDLPDGDRARTAFVRLVSEDASEDENESEREDRRFENALHTTGIVRVARCPHQTRSQRRVERRLRQDDRRLVDEINTRSEDRRDEKNEEDEQPDPVAVEIETEAGARLRTT